MAENTYSIEYSKSARAKCKYSRCGKSIEKDAIRIVKSSASAFGDRPKTENYHPECIFKSFLNARKATRKIESPSDINGMDSLKASEQSTVKKLIKEYTSGELKDKVPKQTRKRKTEDDSSDEGTKKKKKKTKRNNSDDEDEGKHKSKKRKIEDDSDSEDHKPKKNSKKSVRNLSESEEDSGAAKKNSKKSVRNLSESEEDSGAPKKKSKNSKIFDSESEDDRKKNSKKKLPSYSDSEDSEKTAKGKKKRVSEEIDESDSSEKENTSKKFLSGKVIAVSGKLSMPRKDLVKIIERNGGTYATSISKAVTHVICADENDLTEKLEKARDEGKKIVGENFLRIKN